MNKQRKFSRSREVPSQRRAFDLEPKNENQRLYLKALQENSQVIVLGPSGVGKSYVAASYAASLYSRGVISKIIITRPAVSTGRSLGALPGTLDEKFTPWMAPLLEIFAEKLGKPALASAVRLGDIILAPLEYMRGSTFKDAFILATEAQNLSVTDFKMLVTRVGGNCSLVLDGDIRQSDLREESGLSKAIELARKYRMDIPVIEFTLDDIVRSDICKMWVESFYKENL